MTGFGYVIMCDYHKCSAPTPIRLGREKHKARGERWERRLFFPYLHHSTHALHLSPNFSLVFVKFCGGKSEYSDVSYMRLIIPLKARSNKSIFQG